MNPKHPLLVLHVVGLSSANMQGSSCSLPESVCPTPAVLATVDDTVDLAEANPLARACAGHERATSFLSTHGSFEVVL